MFNTEDWWGLKVGIGVVNRFEGEVEGSLESGFEGRLVPGAFQGCGAR